MTKTQQLMNEIYQSKGRTVMINGWESRTVLSVRVMYGGNLQLKLNEPLSSCTSSLFDVCPANIHKIKLL